jgi:hypothetical protein
VRDAIKNARRRFVVVFVFSFCNKNQELFSLSLYRAALQLFSFLFWFFFFVNKPTVSSAYFGPPNKKQPQFLCAVFCC